MDRLSSIYVISAFLLGALHALEPGHGKTLVAAYLVGNRRKILDAVLLGVVVTFTHTFSIICLALAAKLLSSTLSTQTLVKGLEIAASLLIMAVACWLFFRGENHSHSHGHSHNHCDPHNHEHPHNHDHPDQQSLCASPATQDREKSGKGFLELLALGISGGMVPCPAAMAVLLTSVAAGHMTGGLFYVLVFSAGLGCVLTLIGIFFVKLAPLAERFLGAANFGSRVGRFTPILILLVGILTLGKALFGAGGH
ncbi:MAG: sulfite exporter TauE/SafE family protein [Armatimonadetes bacterium]|nr:sulfite exporter TauE/SafE family protein [Armatimonadota bacterium]